mmetsp:Transcript_19706/g.29432  ORF Transcript_19706/g.29432 Transcript_19706/m.29432 type:complete len:790 (-) Transcript_19706:210-2579(-)|eukprot:CAMPEP_0167752654 /NCGR_PEP_ID=MMETSP0110_2-20121227/7260_1 /TAXON_ID=629695 /ORGANISM="Gymnochlora sp., Strain CCMP2014" /LENGTH=789 /DNA_ID=CAMNT_0007638297 /DNA_START=190 /DNA_END=2559 /DNA_ORIENTATION=-
MELYVSHTGQCIKVRALATDTIANLNYTLANETGIPQQNQILLTENGDTLDPAEKIGKYHGLQNGNVAVFLFNRESIFRSPSEEAKEAKETFDPVEDLGILDANDQQASSSTSFGFTASAEYRKKYIAQGRQVQEYVSSFGYRKNRALQIIGVQRVRLRALQAAYQSLRHHEDFMQKTFSTFATSFETVISENRTIFSTFETDLASLRNVELEPGLKVVNKATLLDVLPEGNLRDWLRGCKSRQAHLNKVVEELRQNLESVKYEVKQTGSNKLSSIVTELQHQVEPGEKVEGLFRELLGRLEKNVKWIVNLTCNADSTSDLVTMKDKYKANFCDLRVAQEQCSWSLQVLKKAYDVDTEIRSHFFKTLRKISDLQTKIRSCRKKVSLFKEGAKNLERMCKKFKKIKQLPGVYKRCVMETKRRITFQEDFMGLINQFEAKLGQYHAYESKKRRAFAKENWDFLNQDFFPFLKHNPPRVDINVKQLEKLPNIPVFVKTSPKIVEDIKSNIINNNTISTSEMENTNDLSKTVSELKDKLKTALDENMQLKSERKRQIVVQPSVIEAPEEAVSVHATPTEAVPVHATPTEDNSARLEILEREKEVLTKKIADLTSKMTDLQTEMHSKIDKELELQRSLEESRKNNAHLELRIHESEAENKTLNEGFETMSLKFHQLLEENRKLAKENRKCKAREDQDRMWKEQIKDRISFKSFQIHDIALFHEQKGFYVAYNQNKPARYLAPICQQELKTKPKFILGKIVHIEKRNVKNEKNRYGLPVGAEYQELIVEFLQKVQ